MVFATLDTITVRYFMQAPNFPLSGMWNAFLRAINVETVVCGADGGRCPPYSHNSWDGTGAVPYKRVR